MNAETLRKYFNEEGYYGTTKEFQRVVTELINKIEELEREIEDIKFRYVMRTDVDED